VARLAAEPLDAVVLQRPHEADLVRRWTGRRVGRDLPAVYVEHNAPTGHAVHSRHPLAEDDLGDGPLGGVPLDGRVPVVHVTHFNAMAWDCGSVPTRVVEHGVPDTGYRYTGEHESLAVVVNEPVRRWRVAGTDLVLRFAREVGVDVYGMGMAQLAGVAAAAGVPLEGRLHDDLPQDRLHDAIGRHRAYLHPYRWTSLGLALLEAMTAGMPVLALSTTEAPEAVPADAGLVTNDVDALVRTARRWMHDPGEARERGLAARRAALARYGLKRFLDDWDRLLEEVTR
jgi:hypothetical protein